MPWDDVLFQWDYTSLCADIHDVKIIGNSSVLPIQFYVNLESILCPIWNIYTTMVSGYSKKLKLLNSKMPNKELSQYDVKSYSNEALELIINLQNGD